MALTELARALSSPPPTTVRGRLRKLADLGILERRREAGFAGAVELELTAAGTALIPVAGALQSWLEQSPQGSLTLGTISAKGAISALTEGWSTAVVRVLSATPLSLTQLNRLISGVSYPSLERRITAMRMCGHIERVASKDRGTPYGVTNWLRDSTGAVVAATRWERKYAPGALGSLSRLDVEAILLLSIPRIRLPEARSGVCRLVFELHRGSSGPELVGLTVRVEAGRAVTWAAQLTGDASAWAVGSVSAWLDALVSGDSDWLELGGDLGFAKDLVEGLSGILRQAEPDPPPQPEVGQISLITQKP
ncbi:MAG: winged helix-turn-helix transcriptional regulator [Actinobacteria bacterium]|nr:winged helix-turn-helix transcriptional regulator [Actinomycetota bacterium]